MLLLRIFIAFAKVGLFGYGGGPSMIPLMQEEVVDAHHWLSTEEFVDALAMGNALPGPIATKMSLYVGYKLAGMPGALAGVQGSSQSAGDSHCRAPGGGCLAGPGGLRHLPQVREGMGYSTDRGSHLHRRRFLENPPGPRHPGRGDCGSDFLLKCDRQAIFCARFKEVCT